MKSRTRFQRPWSHFVYELKKYFESQQPVKMICRKYMDVLTRRIRYTVAPVVFAILSNSQAWVSLTVRIDSGPRAVEC